MGNFSTREGPIPINASIESKDGKYPKVRKLKLKRQVGRMSYIYIYIYH
jgi:hypothetical protein